MVDMKHFCVIIGLGCAAAGGALLGDLFVYGNPVWPLIAVVSTLVLYIVMHRRVDAPVLTLLVGAVFFLAVNISAIPFYFQQVI